jgi:hypothetical protein
MKQLKRDTNRLYAEWAEHWRTDHANTTPTRAEMNRRFDDVERALREIRRRLDNGTGTGTSPED